jgi:hypothetical protein
VRILERWLAQRSPEPPEELARELRASLAAADEADDRLVDVLTGAGRQRLGRARARPGRVRESAFHLLATDALFSYACEAALESESPEAALLRIVEAAAEP